jgi:hypothetical protein
MNETAVFFSVSCLFSELKIFWFRHVWCNILYKGDTLELIIYACYLWEIALNVGLDLTFHNI